VSSSPAIWYAARASGVAAYVVLSVVVSLGLALGGKAQNRRWPRFSMEDIHRFGGLLVGSLIGIHVLAIAADSFLPFSLTQLLVPFTGLTETTVEIALVSYTLLVLYRNMVEGLRGVPDDVLESARGMGLTRLQTFVRVELPLAAPTVLAGLRIATVSTISIATVAAFVVPKGLGEPIFIALDQNLFKTEILAAGGLAVALALTADGLLVLAQRAITPWSRTPA